MKINMRMKDIDAKSTHEVDYACSNVIALNLLIKKSCASVVSIKHA